MWLERRVERVDCKLWEVDKKEHLLLWRGVVAGFASHKQCYLSWALR